MLRHSLAEVQGLRIHPAELCRGSRVHVKAWWDAAGRAFAALQTQGLDGTVGWILQTLVLGGGRALKGSGELSRNACSASLLLFSATPLAASAGGLLCLRLIVCKTTPPHFCKTYLPLTQSQAQRAVMR